ncbi:MAG: transposase [Microcystis viridis Mv_BB_P_19951000_S69]|uniref:Transposase n=1 Tax=Microcystis viridis Mv_BB_P_19951000_S68D TaxID=2486270 RepID=A0A552HD15_MICVR|nr:MAG: transposase [Microcystis viridis Mv_BB_P_19951000_S68D]TRU78038.1 MAG: transposase [Microcystis viridis Mv_BB_P_19951000_S68]TRU78798.1 MAG: transposase [Microcystis viridis Mv_BB_P_19951000_S69]TRU90021.1 MAG: transposase [Microcystis viridis Mv_BB_P_19951000_S69D]
MSNYRRPHVFGGTFFITQVTYQREPWLCCDVARKALRQGIEKVRVKYPFVIDAFVLLPDHFHCLWTLPDDDQDFSVRLRLIKTYVTKHYGQALGVNHEVSRSRQKRGEGNLWQRRFWEHLIRDEQDFATHCDYIHDNPVRHGFCENPQDWQYSSIHRFIAQGIYPQDWGSGERIAKPEGFWDD